MEAFPYAVYDAFSDVVFGGSQGGIVLEAGGIDAGQRLQIARELGLPAICFVSSYSATSITARFQSTEREYPMCGHGTICLMTHMLELGVLGWNGQDRIDVELDLPATSAKVEVHRRKDGRSLVMLDISPPEFRHDRLDEEKLAGLLGLNTSDLNQKLPVETALGDFVHLIVPVKALAAMQAIKPDFSVIAQFCKEHGLETIACFSLQVEQSDHHIHVRDFCPSVGVPESAAAGTTNAALTGYLVRHGLVAQQANAKITVKAEQGLEIQRPSSIQSVATMKEGKIIRLQIGGIATKVLDGHLHVQL